MHAAQALAPQVTGTTRAVILLIIAAVVVFRKRLLYLLAYGMIILFTVIVVVGTVVVIRLLHGLPRCAWTSAAALGTELGRISILDAAESVSSRD